MVGRALTSISSFTGAATEDYNNHIRDFQGKIGPQGYAILLAFWTNELFLKLEGPAKSWYNTTYTTQNIRPEWEDLTAGLQRLFGWRYTAADTWSGMALGRRWVPRWSNRFSMAPRTGRQAAGSCCARRASLPVALAGRP